MPRFVVPHIWWLALFLCMLAACALTISQPEPLRLRLATWPGYAPLYAVEQHTLSAPTNLEISTSELAQDNYRAFAERRVDVLATTLYSAVQFQAQGTPTVIILITDYSNGADGIIARPGIDDVSDLRGQRVGVESGSISHLVLVRALQQASLDEDDVQIINIGVRESIDAIDTGKVDAAVVWEPMLSQYERAPIFTSAAIPNEIIDVLVVHPDTLQQRKDDLVNLVRGWDTAVQKWRAGSVPVTITMTNTLNISEAELRQQLTRIELIDLEDNSRLLDLSDPDSIRPAFESMVAFLQSTDQLQAAPPTATEMITAEVVNSARRARATPE